MLGGGACGWPPDRGNARDQKVVLVHRSWALGTATFPFIEDTVIVLNLHLSQLPCNLIEGILV